MRFIVAVALLLLLAATPAVAQVGALQTDCGLGGDQGGGIYQFVATCAGRARSPDGRFAIIQRAYSDAQPPIELQDSRGRTLARLTALSDDMPFAVGWAPNSRWFFVNHHVGSFMDRLRLFEMVGGSAVERFGLVNSVTGIAVRRYPCLKPGLVYPNGVRWMRDSRRIVLFTTSATYACPVLSNRPGRWRTLWMIGDVRSGLVDPRSIRVQPDDGRLAEPLGGPYARR
ncbi:MAG TPA: hypothetical protein VEW26_12425 [Allosphingosinicella sp.]|nr:hypothetical protein [Allosphingosinicella sp.]